MKTKSILATLAAAALALPIVASATNPADKSPAAKSTSASAANDGGAEAMFTSMDKNGDGFISKEEAAGTPHSVDFATLDKDGDGKLSREEHANAKEHVAGRTKAGTTGNSADSATTTTSSSKPSGTKY